jgi:putative iron-regulated protein
VKLEKSMKRTLMLLGFAAILGFSACNDEEELSLSGLKAQAIANYADIVYATYDDAYIAATALKEKISAFVSSPTASGLQECKTAWLAARRPYGQSEAFRFYGGPIDDDSGPEGFLNAWPIDENYIDYTSSQPDNGIINDPDNYPTINKELLLSLNELGSETNISTGYHAIEFLLWGQDFSTDGPGSRSYMDYVVGEAANPERRAQYLVAATELLVEHLKLVRDEWAEGAPYRQAFVNSDNVAQTLDDIFRGMGELSKGELAGERMLVAAQTQDQENEHSCFSDNTKEDLLLNFQGIRNVYYGAYTRIDNTTVSGTSLKQISEKVNKTKADALETSFAEVNAKLSLIPSPFDQAIVNDADLITSAAESLSLLSDRIADVLVDVKK